jgi:hypothetical protein
MTASCPDLDLIFPRTDLSIATPSKKRRNLSRIRSCLRPLAESNDNLANLFLSMKNTFLGAIAMLLEWVGWPVIEPLYSAAP